MANGRFTRLLLAACYLAVPAVSQSSCPSYSSWSMSHHEPTSEGEYQLSYMRPDPVCRTFNASGVEQTIERLKTEISDPDLFRLFENTYPNTLDTAIKWRGVAENNTEEELCFVITGDIDAMWIRDSANQIAPYKYVLKSATDDIASVFRGTINLQARYLVLSPYCNAFLPPPESGISASSNGGGYKVTPSYDHKVVFTCNFELDDFGGFLQLSHDYYKATGDVSFFGKFQWIYAIQSIMAASEAMRQPTYDADGKWVPPAYTFQSQTMSSFGTLGNNGMNNPINGVGLIRSPFRPSDDAAFFDLLIPGNMMMAVYLNLNADIVDQLPSAPPGLAGEMRKMASEIRDAIKKWGIIKAPNGKMIYAYEVDGFGGQNLMDDANIPSLLSAPFLGYVDKNDQIYQNTRQFVLSRENPWYCEGPVINGIGSPHIRPGAAWPMSSIMQIMTTDNDAEIMTALKEVLSSTDKLGFTWANGLFGQMILDLEQRRPWLLKENYQAGPKPSGHGRTSTYVPSQYSSTESVTSSYFFVFVVLSLAALAVYRFSGSRRLVLTRMWLAFRGQKAGSTEEAHPLAGAMV